MNRIFALISLILLLLVPPKTQAQLSLDDAISAAIQKNHDIRLSKANTKLVLDQVNAGNAGLLPTVSVGANSSLSINTTRIEFDGAIPPVKENGAQTTNIGASTDLSYPLFDGMAGWRKLKKLRIEGSRAELAEQVTLENTVVQVAELYLNALQLKLQIDLAFESIAISNDRLNRVKSAFEFGKGSGLDVMNASVNLDQDSASLISIKLAYAAQLNELAFAIGIEDGSGLELNEVFVLEPIEPDELNAAFESRNAAVKLAGIEVDIANADIQILKSALFPQLDLTSSYTYTNQKNDAGLILSNRTNGFTGGLGMRYLLFNGFQQKQRIETAQLSQSIAEMQLEKTSSSIETAFQNALLMYEGQKRLNVLMNSTVELASENFERANEASRLGLITGTEFREAQLNKLNAEYRLSETRIELKLAEFRLLQLSGMLFE